MKFPRAVKFRRAKKRCHDIWSKIVRRRDGECVLCGNTETLQAHHWIIHSGSSLSTRFLIDNGVTLCYACHIFKVHGRGDAVHFDQIKTYMFGKSGLTAARYEEIKVLGKEIAHFSLEDLAQIEEVLSKIMAQEK